MSDNANVIGNAAQRENSEVRDVGEDESGTDGEEFTEDWSQKWILLENMFEIFSRSSNLVTKSTMLNRPLFHAWKPRT